MPFPAKYPGFCRNCRRVVLPGDLISWARRGTKGVWHVDCADPKILARPIGDMPEAPEPELRKTEPEAKPEAPYNGGRVDAGAMATLATALIPHLHDAGFTTKSDGANSVDADAVAEIVQTILADRVPTPIEIHNRDTGEVKRLEVTHKLFTRVLYHVRKGHNLYLWGPAGSGKSKCAQQVADALDVAYGYISFNRMTPESRIMGFIDATGVFRDPEFYRIYTNGGVFCIDELDNGNPALLTSLNAALENGFAAFPCGTVKRHENFVLVCTGNTPGRGATAQYQRVKLDDATPERFIYIQFGYDETLERTISLARNPKATAWVAWVQSVRAYVVEHRIELIASPRASMYGADMLHDSGLEIDEIAESALFKGLDRDTVRKIVDACPYPDADPMRGDTLGPNS